MSIDLHRLVAWFSPSFPIGAFSYSHGLENAVAVGDVKNASELHQWLESLVLYGSGRNDLILLAHSYRSAEVAEIEELIVFANAICSGQERQFENEQQGRAFAKTASAVSEFDFQSGPLPIVVGQACARHELELNAVCSVYLHAFISNLVSAALRLLPIGQIEGQKLLHNLFDAMELTVADAIVSPLDNVGGACFLADIASMAHETQQPRIFRT